MNGLKNIKRYLSGIGIDSYIAAHTKTLTVILEKRNAIIHYHWCKKNTRGNPQVVLTIGNSVFYPQNNGDIKVAISTIKQRKRCLIFNW